MNAFETAQDLALASTTTSVGKRVLIVDDEALITMFLEDMLLEIGCSVVGPAASVADAIPLIDPALVDAALIDVHLAGASSDPIAQALQAHNIPFAFVTGIAQPRSGPFADVPTLQKPFNPLDLERTINRLLG